MNLLICVLTLLVLGQHTTMPQGMSHEEHRKQMEKDNALKQRGTEAMGFDQDAATHHFRLTPTGGAIEVTVESGSDDSVVAAVRNHLRSIASEFAQGDFGKPVATHGEAPAGVAVMQKSGAAITYRYEDLPRGGTVRMAATDGRAVQAIHQFLRYQITEHRTGDPLEVKR
jgi:hypothetical protein